MMQSKYIFHVLGLYPLAFTRKTCTIVGYTSTLVLLCLSISTLFAPISNGEHRTEEDNEVILSYKIIMGYGKLFQCNV